jgi:hypothetical protein
MSSLRIYAFAALLAALALAGCGRGGDAAPSAPEDAAYAKELDDVAAERKRLTAALREAQESGDAGKLAAAADALNENRKRAAAAVREHVNLQSSKKQEK